MFTLCYLHCDVAKMGYVVDGAVGADWADGADRADGTDETDVAEMTLRMNALFYFDRLVHKQAPAESRILTQTKAKWTVFTDKKHRSLTKLL